MANELVEKEVIKILEDENLAYPKNAALSCGYIIANFKGINLKIIDVSATSSLCDYNIIASIQNPQQGKAIIDEITYNLKKNANMQVISYEGEASGDWLLLDLGDVIVHLFQEMTRDLFNLDDLWADYPKLEIPQEFYFAGNSPKSSIEDTKNYF